MTAESLQESEKIIVAIIEKLAVRGVARKDFNIGELGYEKTTRTKELFIDAFVWLEAEGVIRSTREEKFLLSGEQALGFTLTSLGFRLLSENFEGDMTLGQAIRRANETGQGYANVGNLVGGILGSFTRVVSS